MNKKKCFRFSDVGNAKRLMGEHGQDLKYCNGRWLVWDGQRWKRDSKDALEVQRRAQKVAVKIFTAARQLARDEVTERDNKWGMYSESDRGIRAMINQAKSLPGVVVTEDELDANPWLLNCPNGTLDLWTGKLREHRREDLITKITPVEYNKMARKAQWEDFLYRIMRGDSDMMDYLQRAIGYSLTGDTREECIFVLYGRGANGKTTFLETIRKALGEYAMTADFSTFTEKQYEGIRNDLARLKGSRFVTAAETKRGRKFDESTIKWVTGRDTIVARFLYQEHFEYEPEFKIFLACNHMPKIEGTDEGIWRRIQLIQFTVTIPEEEQDRSLRWKLQSESQLQGILRWAVEGCLKWKKEGLQPPVKVLDAKKEYRDGMDFIGMFLKERCDEGPHREESATALYEGYRAFCEENGIKPMPNIGLGKQWPRRGFVSKHSRKGTVWMGLRLKSSSVADLSEDGKVVAFKARAKRWEGLKDANEESYKTRHESCEPNAL